MDMMRHQYYRTAFANKISNYGQISWKKACTSKPVVGSSKREPGVREPGPDLIMPAVARRWTFPRRGNLEDGQSLVFSSSHHFGDAE